MPFVLLPTNHFRTGTLWVLTISNLSTLVENPWNKKKKLRKIATYLSSVEKIKFAIRAPSSFLSIWRCKRSYGFSTLTDLILHCSLSVGCIHFNHNFCLLETHSWEGKVNSTCSFKPKKLNGLRITTSCQYRVRQRGCSLTHSARTPPAVHQGITIWVDEIEFEKK